MVVGFFEVKQIEYRIQIIPPPAELSGREDLMGRLEYERLITADPQTGEIPQGIYKAELDFTRRISETNRSIGQRTNALSITSAGPSNVGGRTRAVAFDIRDENTLIAGGVSGGIWKSTNGGQTWIRKSNPLNRNSITCVVQDTRPGREDTWYHGTGELVGNSTRGGGAPFRGNGIYKSTDNGETWNPLPSTLDAEPNIFNSQFQYIWGMEINEQNLDEDEVYAAAYGGILRSVDGGTSWTVVLGDELFDLPDSVDLNESRSSFYTSISQSKSGVFYATLSTVTSSSAVSDDAGIYVSLDGVGWDNVTPFTEESGYRRIVIGNSDSNPNITYFLVDTDPVFLLKQTIVRYDEIVLNQRFELLETPNFGGELGDFDTQGSYNMMIRVHPENPNIVFAGGTNLYRSTDGFQDSENSKWIGGYNPQGGVSLYPNHHPDQHELLFYPSNPDKMLSASDGGLRVSQDGTADSVMWSSINNGFLTSQFFTIAQSKIEGDPTLLGGMQDNGTDLTSSAGFSSWDGLLGGDGGFPATTRSNDLWFASFQRGQTLRLTLDQDFDITSFGRVDPGALVQEANSQYLFVNPFVLDPLNENRAFFAGGNHLYFHPNVSQIPGGTQEPNPEGWVRVTEDNSLLGSVSAVAATPNGERVYFGTSGGQLFRLNNADNAADFEVVEITDTGFAERSYVSCIAVDLKDADHLMVVFSNYNIPSVFESFDGGLSFVDVSGNLEENPDGSGNGQSIRWGEIVPVTGGGSLYLLGTSTGLFSTTETSGFSTVWVQESQDLIGNAIIPMMDYRPSDGSLAIASHGNGVFVTQIEDFERIEPEAPEVDGFAVVSSYPNPFAERTSIRYTLPEDGIVRINIYTLKGELINNLLWAPQFAGTNEVVWEGTNAADVPMSDGLYFFSIDFQNNRLTGKLALRR